MSNTGIILPGSNPAIPSSYGAFINTLTVSLSGDRLFHPHVLEMVLILMRGEGNFVIFKIDLRPGIIYKLKYTIIYNIININYNR